MIKKILFVAFIIFISIFVSNLLMYNDEIIINYLGYQIATTTGFLVFLLVSLVLFVYLILYIIDSILHPNLKNCKKSTEKLEKKFNKYLELITEAFIYKSARNTKESFAKLKKANKIFKSTNLSKLLESQLYYIKQDYKKSEESFKEIQDSNLNLNLLNLRINLEQAKKANNVEHIKSYSEQILKIEPVNKTALEHLFKIYIGQKDWEGANKILELALKSKTFDRNKMQKEILFVYTALGKNYYDRGNFAEAKKMLRNAYEIDDNCIQAAILLVKTYIGLGKKSKAMSLIKKVWKYNTNPHLADLYFSLLNEKDKKSIKSAEVLYKLNPKSFESNLILARAYFNQELYSKARKYAKIAESVGETKSIYELMLQIEQADNGSSAMIANLKKKILNAKNRCWKCSVCNREYVNWQPQCNNCGSLNSLEWKE